MQQAYPQVQPGQVIPQSMPVTQDEMYAHLIQEEKIKNIISQISPSNYLQEIRWMIKGYYKDDRIGRWEKIDPEAKEPDPLLVSRFMAYLGSIINQNTTLSNLSENQVNKIMAQIIEYITDDLDAHAEDYEIGSDYTERTRIGDIMLNSVFMVMNRALNGMEAKRMWGSLSMAEQSNPFQQQSQKSPWYAFWK